MKILLHIRTGYNLTSCVIHDFDIIITINNQSFSGSSYRKFKSLSDINYYILTVIFTSMHKTSQLLGRVHDSISSIWGIV